MQNTAIILTLLILPYWALTLVGAAEPLRGRAGVALVFAFTGLGHFTQTSAMAQMLPGWVPGRVLLIYITGILEMIAAVALLTTPLARVTGMALCVFLLMVLPANIYAAFHRVDFGGHGAGPVYLLVRIPLQFFLLGWIYWFTIERSTH